MTSSSFGHAPVRFVKSDRSRTKKGNRSTALIFAYPRPATFFTAPTLLSVCPLVNSVHHSLRASAPLLHVKSYFSIPDADRA
jgi:hypothetical protein